MIRKNSLDRSVALLSAMAQNPTPASVIELAASLELPTSSAHRLINKMVERNILVRVDPGQYVAGPVLLNLSTLLEPKSILADLARPFLRSFVHRKKATAHLGIWDGEMITYLVKENGLDQNLFTLEGSRLEAYCSAIGRILLAHLPTKVLDTYLAEGNFVSLTQHTETDPANIRTLLEKARQDAFACDDQEIADGLFCIAVPVIDANGNPVSAISLSISGPRDTRLQHLNGLQKCAAQIGNKLNGYGPNLSRHLSDLSHQPAVDF